MKNEILNYLKTTKDSFYLKSKKFEEYNKSFLEGKNLAAYYTNEKVVQTMVDKLPLFENLKEITILEPSTGIGNFVPYLIEKYKNKKINFILNDIDPFVIECLKLIFLNEKNINFNFTNEDFLKSDKFENMNINLIIGNPPYFKITDKLYLKDLKNRFNDKSSNIFAYFIQKSLLITKNVSFIVPKGLLFVPEFKKTRELLKNSIINIIDYQSEAFKIKIETISFLSIENNNDNIFCEVINYKDNISNFHNKNYIFNEKFPIWLIYRNSQFDETLNKLELNLFNVYRDREITNSMLNDSNGKWVLKGRNLQQKVIHIENYDKFCIHENTQIGKIIDKNFDKQILIAPNLINKPRFLFLPKNVLVNGSVALFILKNDFIINENDLSFLNSDEFYNYFNIVRNKSNRSINLDNNIGFFIGLLKR